MPITIKEIAKKAGVSFPVVSAVVNDNYKNTRVSEEKREKILKIIQQFNFMPNTTARNLAKGRTQTINMVIPSTLFFAVKSYTQFIIGLQSYLIKQNYHLQFTSLEARYQQYKNVGRIHGDAIVMFYWGAKYIKVIRALSRFGLPVLSVYGRCTVKDVANLYYDNHTAMYLLAKKVIENGHQNIALAASYIGDTYHRQGLAGIKKAVEEKGISHFNCIDITPDQNLQMESDRLIKIGQIGVRKALELSPRPTVLMFNHDVSAVAAINEARSLGISVPEELSITGNGNDPAGFLCRPQLTTTESKGQETGARAGELLLALIEKKGKHFPHEKVALQPIIRESLRRI